MSGSAVGPAPESRAARKSWRARSSRPRAPWCRGRGGRGSWLAPAPRRPWRRSRVGGLPRPGEVGDSQAGEEAGLSGRWPSWAWRRATRAAVSPAAAGAGRAAPSPATTNRPASSPARTVTASRRRPATAGPDRPVGGQTYVQPGGRVGRVRGRRVGRRPGGPGPLRRRLASASWCYHGVVRGCVALVGRTPGTGTASGTACRSR